MGISTLSFTTLILLHLLAPLTTALPHLRSESPPLPPSSLSPSPSPTRNLSPRAAGPPNFNCRSQTHQNIIHQHGPFPAPPRLVAGEQCAAHAAGCSIASGKMYGVTLTWQAGADLFLNLGGLFTAGLLGGVSVGDTTTTAVTTTVVCPSMCRCGIVAVPMMYHVEGVQTTVRTPVENGPCKRSVAKPFSVDLPVLDRGASVGDQAVVEFSACRVANSTCARDESLPACPLA